MSFDHLIPRILLGVLILTLCICIVGIVGTVIDQRRNREAQSACRERGGMVVLAADGEWCCAREESR